MVSRSQPQPLSHTPAHSPLMLPQAAWASVRFVKVVGCVLPLQFAKYGSFLHDNTGVDDDEEDDEDDEEE